jgi:hypothetical protein
MTPGYVDEQPQSPVISVLVAGADSWHVGAKCYSLFLEVETSSFARMGSRHEKVEWRKICGMLALACARAWIIESTFELVGVEKAQWPSSESLHPTILAANGFVSDYAL